MSNSGNAAVAVSDAIKPNECPFCKSGDVTAAGQKITTSTYWRCQSCGKVWNPARLRQDRGFRFGNG